MPQWASGIIGTPEGIRYIFAFGENKGVAGALPGDQGSAGALDLIFESLPGKKPDAPMGNVT